MRFVISTFAKAMQSRRGERGRRRRERSAAWDAALGGRNKIRSTVAKNTIICGELSWAIITNQTDQPLQEAPAASGTETQTSREPGGSGNRAVTRDRAADRTSESIGARPGPRPGPDTGRGGRGGQNGIAVQMVLRMNRWRLRESRLFYSHHRPISIAER